MPRAPGLAVCILPVIALLAGPAIADDVDGTASSVIRAGDIDRDGVEDVLVLGRGPLRGQLLALRMPSFEVLWSVIEADSGFGENIHDVGDFNDDGVTDFAVGSSRWERSNVAVLSGSDGSLLTRKFGIRLAIRLTDEPLSWLVTTHGDCSIRPPACVRIDPRTDGEIGCYSLPSEVCHCATGWDVARARLGGQTYVAIGCGTGAWIFTLDGDIAHAFKRHTPQDELGWSCASPSPSSGSGAAHLVIGTHHRRCELFDLDAWQLVREISGQNVTGVADAFASSVDAYYEPTADEPTVVVGAAEMWAEGFDAGYVTLSRPLGSGPLVLLRNGEIGFHACFIGDLDRDGAREIFAVEVSPTRENGRARKDTTVAYVLDGKTGREVSKGSVKFLPPLRKPQHR